ncbi:MAG: AsmA family protein [Bacteroidetes bacterium]|nr:MAG: AsmA family protein [Bacteroidota bacterium]
MKKFLKISALTLVGLFLLLLVAPFFFQGKIREMVETEANRSLNAQVYFGEVGLSFIRNFPQARVSIRDFGVVGKGAFVRDTLVQGRELALVVDMASIWRGGDLRIRGLDLDRPKMRLVYLSDGQANWDIVPPDTAATAPADTGSSSFRIALERYRLSQAEIVYVDESLPMTLSLKGMDHEGRGDLTATVYDLATESEVADFYVDYDGITYFQKAKLSADAVLHIDITRDIVMAFKDNRFVLNGMALGLDGSMTLPEGSDDIVMDLSFDTPGTDFKSLLSLVPGAYTADFADIKAEGDLAFNGYARGIYNDSLMPAFGLTLKVPGARLQYPDVPEPITNIRIDMSVENPDGDPENTRIDLRDFHADLGQNPIDMQARIAGLSHMTVDGRVDARLNLAELTQMFPVEGTDLKGSFRLQAEAKGVYDQAQGRFPEMNAEMEMADGYLKNAEYPAELTELGFLARLSDPDGQLSSAVMEVPNFHFLLDGEPVDGRLEVQNFDNPAYRLQAAGHLDLEKLLQVYPIEGMNLSGRLVVEDFETRGTYADIEAENYMNLPTRGTVRLENFVYTDAELPAPVSIAQGTATFTPEQLQLTGVSGQAGRSDFAVEGNLTQYLAYALADEATLGGQISLRSQLLDLNEWMSEEETPADPAPGEEVPLEAIPVPDNLDLGVRADLAEVHYDDLVIEDLQGDLRIADASVVLEETRFRMLGSQVAMSGAYQTKNPATPAYNFYLDVDQLQVEKAFQTFTVVQRFAPALEFVQGVANLEFGISGLLARDMMPILEEVNSLGVFTMVRGGIEQMPLLSGISSVTKLQNLTPVDLKEVSGKFEIADGFLHIAPIDLKAGATVLALSGSQRLTGEMDYVVQVDAPSNRVDQAATAALSRLAGTTIATGDRLQVNLRVRGTRANPQITGAGGGTGDQVKDQLSTAAEDKLNQSLGTDVSLDRDSLRGQAQAIGEVASDSVKALAQEAKQQVADSLAALGDQAKEALQEEAKERVGEGAQQALDSLKAKFGWPKRKKN